MSDKPGSFQDEKVAAMMSDNPGSGQDEADEKTGSKQEIPEWFKNFSQEEAYHFMMNVKARSEPDVSSSSSSSSATCSSSSSSSSSSSEPSVSSPSPKDASELTERKIVTKTNPEIAIIKKRKERAAATPTGRGREHKIRKNYKEVDTTEDEDAICVVGVRQTIKVYDPEIAGLESDESHTTLENKGNYVVIKEACRVLSRPDMPFKAVFGKLNIC
jgi:hypothetical protein